MATILFLVLVVAVLCVAPSRGQVSYCPAYTASNTASATTNYVTCTINVCNGWYTIGMCANGGTYSGDTYLRLVSSTGDTLISSDDGCGNGSEIKYTVTTGCQTLTLRQGCYDSYSCTGTVSITSVDLTATPSRAPTVEPTSVSAVPTATPTASPSATPSTMPTFTPSRVPTAAPTSATPSSGPSVRPSSMPSSEPSSSPSATPSSAPSSSPTSPAESSSLSRREKSLIVLAITLPAVVVGLSLLLIPVYCFFFASQMFANAPSNKDTSAVPTEIAPAVAASSVPEKEVVYDVLAADDNTANI